MPGGQITKTVVEGSPLDLSAHRGGEVGISSCFRDAPCPPVGGYLTPWLHNATQGHSRAVSTRGHQDEPPGNPQTHSPLGGTGCNPKSRSLAKHRPIN